MTPSMRTTGAHEDSATLAAHKRCLRSCMPAVVRPCCCTFCCTELTRESQGSSVRLPPTLLSIGVGLFVPKPSTGVDCQRRSIPSLGQAVRGYPLASTAVRGDCHSLCHSAASRAGRERLLPAHAFQAITPRGLPVLSGAR
jgi:hypothetical protein